MENGISAAAASEKDAFPEDFLWGAATSAYQIEGSPLADGAGASNWHRFAHTPGRTLEGHTGDVACDHYRRYPEDVELMRSLRLKAYRFSLAWGRILPEGRGTVNQAGLDFYRRLIDLLLQNGIEPCVTLFHWDLPAALEDRGGWLNPEIDRWFADYARICFQEFDGKVKLWATINEPWVVADAGYLHGVHAPGHRDLYETPIAARNLLRAHASAVQTYRTLGRHKIGLVVNLAPKDAASDDPADRAAAAREDAYMNRQYLDPILRGSCPPEMREIFGDAWQEWDEHTLKLVREPVDFLGINYYTRSIVRHDPDSPPVCVQLVEQPQKAVTETGWEVYPEGLTRILCWVKERYGDLPLYVTENGAAFHDPPQAPGAPVEDPRRADYIRRHIPSALEARRLGVDLRGYFVWSLLDNFEWAAGYSKRFGIIHVDYATQKRTLKASAHAYREIIAAGGAEAR
ncbi:MAG: beta-glucosidase [Candidatus Eisenbacteria bacterium]|nr:beta-glucosidase [Candidatus Eisenbacteria bacterium]